MSDGMDDEPGEVSAEERPVSPHPNFVTADGLALIELQLARQQALWDAAEAAGDQASARSVDRELRYWLVRRATAQVVAPPPDTARVHFGSTVTIARGGAARETCRIVGEDEADPDQGLLAYVSPLAQALMGRGPGEVVRQDGAEIEIVSIG